MKNWIEQGFFIKQNTSLPDNKITFIPKGNDSAIVLSEYGKERFSLRFNVMYFIFRQIREEIPSLGLADWRKSEFFCLPRSYSPQYQYDGMDVVDAAFQSLNRFEIRNALNVCLKFQLVDQELVNRILELIGVNEDENVIYNCTLELLCMGFDVVDISLSHDAIELAKSAHSAGHHSIVFKLAEYLRSYYKTAYSDTGKKLSVFDECNIKGVIDLYKSIDVSNPHYAEATQQVKRLEKWGVETLNMHRLFSRNSNREEAQPTQRYRSFSF